MLLNLVSTLLCLRYQFKKKYLKSQMKYLYEEKLIKKEKTILLIWQIVFSGRRLTSIRHFTQSINNAGNKNII